MACLFIPNGKAGNFKFSRCHRQNYHLRLDIYESSYASLCTETIDRSIDNDELSQFGYELLHFVIAKIKSGVSAQLMSVSY